MKPELIPKPPFFPSTTSPAPSEPSTATNKQAPPKGKTNQTKSTKSKKGGKQTGNAKSQDGAVKQRRRRLPQPPGPQPMLATCVSQYSPALPTGVLVDTIKAGMNAAADAPPIAGGAGGKGKRKVVRVRA